MKEKTKWILIGFSAGCLLTGILTLHLGLSLIRASHIQDVAAQINMANISRQAQDLTTLRTIQTELSLCSIEYLEQLETSLYYFQANSDDIQRLRASIDVPDQVCSL